MDYVLGVDGGASKTLIRVADTNGKKITEIISGPTNYRDIRIYEDNAKELVLSVLTVVKKLDLSNKYFDLVLSGGLFKYKKHFTNIILGMLSEQFSNIKFIQLEKNPVEGAIKLAIENL